MATSPLPSRGSPHRDKIKMATSPLPSRGPHGGEKLKWLHRPCLLGVTMVGRNQNGYITPAFMAGRTQPRKEWMWWRCAKRCEKGWKWVEMGENPKMPYPQCGRSIKNYARGNNDAPSISKHGSLVRPDAQIVALRTHYAECAQSSSWPTPLPQFWGALLTCCEMHRQVRYSGPWGHMCAPYS